MEVMSVFGIPHDPWPKRQGIFYGNVKRFIGSACQQGALHPHLKSFEYGYGQTLTFRADIVCCGACGFQVLFERV